MNNVQTFTRTWILVLFGMFPAIIQKIFHCRFPCHNLVPSFRELPIYIIYKWVYICIYVYIYILYKLCIFITYNVMLFQFVSVVLFRFGPAVPVRLLVVAPFPAKLGALGRFKCARSVTCQTILTLTVGRFRLPMCLNKTKVPPPPPTHTPVSRVYLLSYKKDVYTHLYEIYIYIHKIK